MKLKLKSATSVSLTSDVWSSSATEGYITVTAHFLTNEWNMFSCVLETSGFQERHTSVNIADKLGKIGESFSINKKVSTVVHDNAANMVS